MYAVTFNAARPLFSGMLMVRFSTYLLLLCCRRRFSYLWEKFYPFNLYSLRSLEEDAFVCSQKIDFWGVWASLLFSDKRML